METLKEIAVDAIVVLLGWVVITATSIHPTKGLICGPQVSSIKKAP